jgi:hypothetical protein
MEHQPFKECVHTFEAFDKNLSIRSQCNYIWCSSVVYTAAEKMRSDMEIFIDDGVIKK